MAIEIDEMVVKARTGPDPAGKEFLETASKKVRDVEREMEMLKKQLLLECREMILEIIQDRMER
jgi:Family of unknown function (DUF5908)